MTDAVLAEGEPPPPEPEGPTAYGPRDWLHRNLFRSAGDSIVTVIATIVLGYVAFRLGRYVFVTGRWSILQANLTLFMVGRFPRDEVWRVGVAVCAIAGYSGVLAGFINRRQAEAGRAEPRLPLVRQVRSLAGRLWPLLLGVVVLLALTRTFGPTLVVIALTVSAFVGRLMGTMLSKRWGLPLVLIGIVGAAAVVFLLTQAAELDRWGGVMLNVFLAAAGILLSFPLGVLLALGRRAGRSAESMAGGIVVAALLAAPALFLLIRHGFDVSDVFTWMLVVLVVALAVGGFQLGRKSTLPLVRVVSVAYIEFFRGVPLYVLLLLGAQALRFFLPRGMETPGFVIRAIVVFTIFTAAYIAEIVRGGLQSLPRGQTEAAQALGLSPTKTTGLIVLPQALRNVIPALVGQFISLFKDTTLAGAAMGFLDILQVRSAASSQGDFRGQLLAAEVLTFVMFVFWVGCITMSRESQRLERKLGVGTR